MTRKFPDVISYCGIYCAACPSFGKTCKGCRSESRNQERTSKWGCRIRKCCKEKGYGLCFQCSEFPCIILRTKITESHPGDRRFSYRHELLDNKNIFTESGTEKLLSKLKAEYTCKKCGGVVAFYVYTCKKCGHGKAHS